ncbi:MAG: hypothetical protein JWO82_3815 [Akkermansiaceae bacterium]|nr:hypothetical protein [Akkermansiaceae bacterium]
MIEWRRDAGQHPCMLLRVHALPNARKSEVVGWEDDARLGRVLRVRIAAPPLEGKANEALRAFLAVELGVAKSRVSLQKGDSSRFKAFEIPEMPLPWPF